MATADNDLHTLLGAYVMDAVTEFERVRFTRHLAGCQECRAEIRELREAAARLGTATAVRPRSDLKQQTIRAAGRISQLPPAVPAGGPVTSRTGRAGQAWRKLTLTSKTMLAAAAVLVAGACVLGVVTQQTMRQLNHSQRQSHMIAAVLNAPDVVILTAQVSSGGMATVMMSHREHALVFTAHGLPALPAAQAYELWLMGPGGDRPAGLLAAARDGMAGPAVVSGLTDGDMVGLTVEPATGSRQPTSVPIVLIGPKRG